MKKFKVALGLAKLSVLQLLALAKLIVQKMTGNGNFPTPDPALSDISDAVTVLQGSVDAVAAAKKTLAEKVADQTTNELALRELLTFESNYVDNRAKGDKAIIESAGMGVAGEGSPVGEMPQVENLSLSRGDNPGEVDVHYDPVAKKKNYTIQSTTDPIADASVWVTRGNPTKSSFTITGLTSGTKVWVQVCANGTLGAGPFSDPAIIVVP